MKKTRKNNQVRQKQKKPIKVEKMVHPTHQLTITRANHSQAETVATKYAFYVNISSKV